MLSADLFALISFMDRSSLYFTSNDLVQTIKNYAYDTTTEHATTTELPSRNPEQAGDLPTGHSQTRECPQLR